MSSFSGEMEMRVSETFRHDSNFTKSYLRERKRRHPFSLVLVFSCVFFISDDHMREKADDPFPAYLFSVLET